MQVLDTGPGMDPAFVRGGLFEPFRQESEGLNRRYEGAGLGMAVAHRFIEAMRGRITVDTSPGQGTTVTIFLPRIDAQPPPHTLGAASGSSRSTPAPTTPTGTPPPHLDRRR